MSTKLQKNVQGQEDRKRERCLIPRFAQNLKFSLKREIIF